jgi:hypothetical protein
MALFNECLNRTSKKDGHSRDYISHLPPGPDKRNIIDDMTILVLSLENQAE